MKVILIKDVKGIGMKGDCLEVAEGHARNYLIPRGLAKEGTEGNLKSLQLEKDRQEAKAKKIADQARAEVRKLEGAVVRVKARSGEGGKLFGSITAKDVAEALVAQHRVAVDRRKIDMETIKSLGTVTATVRLHPEAVAKIQVVIEEE